MLDSKLRTKCHYFCSSDIRRRGSKWQLLCAALQHKDFNKTGDRVGITPSRDEGAVWIKLHKESHLDEDTFCALLESEKVVAGTGIDPLDQKRLPPIEIRDVTLRIELLLWTFYFIDEMSWLTRSIYSCLRRADLLLGIIVDQLHCQIIQTALWTLPAPSQRHWNSFNWCK